MKNRLSMSRVISGLLAVGLLFVCAPAWAQQTDFADCQLTVDVVPGVSIAATNSPIDLGTIPDGSNYDSPGIGGGEFAPAAFSVTGPDGLDWEFSVAYTNLSNGVGTITVSAPTGVDVCYDDAGNCLTPTCTSQGEAPLTVAAANHDAAGAVCVGYNIDVVAPIDTSAPYTSAQAVRVTIEALTGA